MQTLASGKCQEGMDYITMMSLQKVIFYNLHLGKNLLICWV